jgi:hypothetical protein
VDGRSKTLKELDRRCYKGELDTIRRVEEFLIRGEDYDARRGQYMGEIVDLDASLGCCNKMSNHIRLMLADAASEQDDNQLAISLLREIHELSRLQSINTGWHICKVSVPTHVVHFEVAR